MWPPVDHEFVMPMCGSPIGFGSPGPSAILSAAVLGCGPTTGAVAVGIGVIMGMGKAADSSVSFGRFSIPIGFSFGEVGVSAITWMAG